MDAKQKYMRSFWISMVLYVVLLMAAVFLTSRVISESPWRFLVILLPVLPIAYGMRAFLEFLASLDEMQQRLQLEAFGFSLAVTGLLTFAYGLLQSTGLPELSMIWVFPLMIFLWGIGQWIASRKYA